MRMEGENQNIDEFGDFDELDLASYDDKVYMNLDNTEQKDVMIADSDNNLSADQTEAPAQQASEEADGGAEAENAEAEVMDEDARIAAEFYEMDNVVVINGKKRKEKKKKKKLSKQGAIILNSGIGAVCVALFLTVAIMFGPFIWSIIFADGIQQSLDSSEMIVDMTDLPYKFGTVNSVDLTKTFPNGSDFSITEGASSASIKSGNILTVVPTAEDPFVITYTKAGEEGAAATQVTVNCEIVPGGVNIDTWDAFVKAAEGDASKNISPQIIVLQDNIECEKLEGKKKKDYGPNKGGVTISNDLYGNGKVVNVFEIVCCRSKASSTKFGAPYPKGNGKVGGNDGILLKNKENGEQLIVQDVHFTGCDMNNSAAVYEGDEVTEETPAPASEGETPDDTDRVLVKRAGNLYPLSDEDMASRGVLLFSNYGAVINAKSDDLNDKLNAKILHCVVENGGKVVHVSNAYLDIEGTIIRNAADTALSVATTHDMACVINSKNNVIANSLTGGILFYCFDDKITAGNAEETWNTLNIEGFLDIYNWKRQDGLAFLPETEPFAGIANPIASGEIPKTSYDGLKGEADGAKWIHFAIIKIRTGNGLPQNGSTVNGYKDIGFSTSRENGFSKGFPIPDLASAIMKELEVWGYYNNDASDVTPNKVLGGTTPEEKALFYKELREGRENIIGFPDKKAS